MFVTKEWSIPVWQKDDVVHPYDHQQTTIVSRMWSTFLDLAAAGGVEDEQRAKEIHTALRSLNRTDVTKLLHPERLYGHALMAAIFLGVDKRGGDRVSIARRTCPIGHAPVWTGCRLSITNDGSRVFELRTRLEPTMFTLEMWCLPAAMTPEDEELLGLSTIPD